MYYCNFLFFPRPPVHVVILRFVYLFNRFITVCARFIFQVQRIHNENVQSPWNTVADNAEKENIDSDIFAVFVLRFSKVTMTCNRHRPTKSKVIAYDDAGRLISIRGSFLNGQSSDHEIRLIASFFYGSSRFRTFSRVPHFRHTVNVTGKTTVCGGKALTTAAQTKVPRHVERGRPDTRARIVLAPIVRTFGGRRYFRCSIKVVVLCSF